MEAGQFADLVASRPDLMEAYILDNMDLGGH